MSSINKAMIIGRLGQDPEIKYMPSGGAVANISIATSEQWKDKDTGEKREKTEWHRVSIFGKLAEIAGEYLRKGSQVYIEGKLQTRKWQDQSGQDRYTTEIVVQPIGGAMQMLGGKRDNNQKQGGGQQGWGQPHHPPQQQLQQPQSQPQQQQPQQGRQQPPVNQQPQQQPMQNQQPQQQQGGNQPDFEDDIPFN